MRFEENRLKTFIFGNYKCKNISAEYLAKNGFFYTLLNDIVQCCFCRIVIGNIERCWDATFINFHKAKSPLCKFFSEINSNVPIINNPQQITPLTTNDRTLCKVCLENEVSILLMDCRHLVLCRDCSNNESIQTCPVCRTSIYNKFKVYLS